MSDFDPIIYERTIAKRSKEKALAEQAKRFEAEKAREVRDELEATKAEKRAKFENSLGTFGKYILEAGWGGGFAGIPHAIDIYECALGLSRDETWLIKRLISYLPNVHPSMTTIANQALGKNGKPLSDKTVRRIKQKLIEKGFIRDNGAEDLARGKLNHVLNLAPFFDAVFLCMMCDPKSKLVVNQALDKARTDFTYQWFGKNAAEAYEGREEFSSIELPLFEDIAREFADARGFKLNWQHIDVMQNCEAIEKLEDIAADKVRELEIKHVITESIQGMFGFTWYKENYAWVKEIASTTIKLKELEDLTKEYVKRSLYVSGAPTAKAYKAYISEILALPSNKKILAEREVIRAKQFAYPR